MRLALILVTLLLSANAFALRVAVISDLNPGYGNTRYSRDVDRAIARIIAMKPDLVINTGDMVAGQRPRNHFKRKQLEPMWRAFHRHVSEPLAAAGIPMAVTPGNHDASVYAGFALERRIYQQQWNARRPALTLFNGGHYPLNHAFTLGDVLFISLDVTRPGALDPEQMDWLTRLLQQQGPDYRHRPQQPVRECALARGAPAAPGPGPGGCHPRHPGDGGPSVDGVNRRTAWPPARYRKICHQSR